MLEWIQEHKVIVIVGIIVVGFGAFVLSQKSSPQQDPGHEAFVSVDLKSPMSKGNKNAKVSVVQYSDFLCPSCTLFSTQVMPTIDKEYIQTGKVKFEYRPMAIVANGSSANGDGSIQSGIGAYCAIDQDKFWTYHDAIYKYTYEQIQVKHIDPRYSVILTDNLIEQIASQAGLDSKTFNSCMDSKKYSSKIVDATQLASSNGVDGTPYILVNGQRYTGNVTIDVFEPIIKASL